MFCIKQYLSFLNACILYSSEDLLHTLCLDLDVMLLARTARFSILLTSPFLRRPWHKKKKKRYLRSLKLAPHPPPITPFTTANTATMAASFSLPQYFC